MNLLVFRDPLLAEIMVTVKERLDQMEEDEEDNMEDDTDEEDEDPSNFHRNRNSNFPPKQNTKNYNSKFVVDQQMHPSRARSVGPQPKFSHKHNNVSRCVHLVA